MNAPAMRADSVARIRTLEESAAAIQAAVANTAAVMPPVAARWMASELSRAASIEAVRVMSWQCLDHWLELADEINAHAARARRYTEHEVFLAGSTPDDAAYTEPAETRDIALAANGWLAGAGAAHREVTRLYGPWQIDRPANAIKETAA